MDRAQQCPSWYREPELRSETETFRFLWRGRARCGMRHGPQWSPPASLKALSHRVRVFRTSKKECRVLKMRHIFHTEFETDGALSIQFSLFSDTFKLKSAWPIRTLTAEQLRSCLDQSTEADTLINSLTIRMWR